MSFVDTYNYYFWEYADQRTNKWFLVGSPTPVMIIMFSYLYFVLKCGPRYMENKKPYSLKTFIEYYNIFQIIVNSWIMYSLISAGWFTTISVGCEPVDYSNDATALKLASIVWWTYMLKLVDLIETPLFVLRKKNRQISVLHLYHHISTVLIVWLSTKYIAGGMSTFSILVNSVVHVIMYSYYYFSSKGKRMQQYTNLVKPYITLIQMVQFVILLVHTAQALCPRCKVPRFPAVAMIMNLLANFYLFYDFYKKSYVKPKKS